MYWNAIGLLSVWYYEGRGVYTCIHYYTCNTGAFSNGHWKGTYPNIDKQNKQTIWLFTKLRLSLDGREVKSSAHPFSSGKFKLVFNKQLKIKHRNPTEVKGIWSVVLYKLSASIRKMNVMSTIIGVLYHFATSYWVVVSTKCTIYHNYIHFSNDLFYMHWSKIVGSRLLFKKKLQIYFIRQKMNKIVRFF